MKKFIQIFLLLALANNIIAQGFFKKLKDKVTNKIEATPKAVVTTVATPSGGSTAFADPAPYGKVVVQLSDKDIAAAPDGFILFFESAQFANGQLSAKVNFNAAVYDYTSGNFQKTAVSPSQGYAYINNHSEKDLLSVDISQVDQMAILTKTGPHIASGMVPGKMGQDLTFNGKKIATYYTFGIIRNFDSTAVAAAGASLAGGKMAYSLTTMTGQKVPIPMNQLLMLSPNGSIAGNFIQAAIIRDDPSISAQMKATGAFVYLTNGKKIAIANAGDNSNDGMWLSNNGNIFAIDNSDKKNFKKNDTLLFSSDAPIDTKQLFISHDDKSWAWVGARDLHFSDGTVFPEVFNAYRVYNNGKDVILFLTKKDKQILLCQKEL